MYIYIYILYYIYIYIYINVYSKRTWDRSCGLHQEISSICPHHGLCCCAAGATLMYRFCDLFAFLITRQVFKKANKSQKRYMGVVYIYIIYKKR